MRRASGCKFYASRSAAGVAIIVACTVAHACAQYSKDKVNGPRWVILMLAAGGVVTIYFIVIPRLAAYTLQDAILPWHCMYEASGTGTLNPCVCQGSLNIFSLLAFKLHCLVQGHTQHCTLSCLTSRRRLLRMPLLSKRYAHH